MEKAYKNLINFVIIKIIYYFQFKQTRIKQGKVYYFKRFFTSITYNAK